MSIKIEIIRDGAYLLKEDKTVISEGKKITVKKGFDFDGASIPKALWSIIGSPLNGDYVTAGLIHDGLYASQLLTRKQSDDIFLDLMKQDGVGYVKRYAMYWSVRSFGARSWEEAGDDSLFYKKFVTVKELNK